MRKYTYYRVIQGYYGQGWEDVDFHEVNSQGMFRNREDRLACRENIKAYRENEREYSHRVITRKELNKCLN